MSRSPLINYIVKNQDVVIQVDFLKEIFMIPDRMEAKERVDTEFIIETYSTLYKGKLFTYQGYFYSISTFERIDDRSSDLRTYKAIGEETGIIHDPNEKTPLATPQDKFLLEANEILNYKDPNPLTTTLGRFIANICFLVWPFGDIIPYLNEEFTAAKLEKRISIPLLEGRISVRDVKDKYVNALYLIGTSTEIFSPNISEKTITIPQHIHDLRVKLVEQNREALEAGDTSVMTDIEQQLIKAYKDYLQGDPSLRFLIKSKYFNVTLKKLFLTQGMVEVFGSPGKFKFIEQPMGSGWKKENLPEIFNEIRSGSFSRAIETANGGVIAKLILRIFQDTRLTSEDCGTNKGEAVNLDKDQLKDFLWNYVIEKNGKTTLITEETLDQFVDKDIVVRTPGYCQEEKGFCAKCFGKTFETLGQKAFGPVANTFAGRITQAALSKMHGSTVATVNVTDLNKYLI